MQETDSIPGLGRSTQMGQATHSQITDFLAQLGKESVGRAGVIPELEIPKRATHQYSVENSTWTV